jgi:alkanesulfonate monooxygenase SsuD/methylene tetrahydromethanopterin reductase-like flavin-dependent oxidoreductase (luciferase family)
VVAGASELVRLPFPVATDQLRQLRLDNIGPLDAVRDRFGFEPRPIAVHSPGHVAATDQEAREQLWPHYEAMMNRIGAERGWQPASRAHFEHEAGPHGALCVGSPETVAAKIAKTVRTLGLSRFDLKYSSGTLSHELMLKSIALIGAEVAPRVRAAERSSNQ